MRIVRDLALRINSLWKLLTKAACACETSWRGCEVVGVGEEAQQPGLVRDNERLTKPPQRRRKSLGPRLAVVGQTLSVALRRARPALLPPFSSLPLALWREAVYSSCPPVLGKMALSWGKNKMAHARIS